MWVIRDQLVGKCTFITLIIFDDIKYLRSCLNQRFNFMLILYSDLMLFNNLNHGTFHSLIKLLINRTL